jgi:lipopolysaccharide assembly outer membrane protein LptD (OstA)
MKRLALLLCVAVLALAQTQARHGDVSVSADQAKQNGDVRRLVGHVTIETGAIILRADEADYDDASGEIVARGDVHVKLK